MANNSIVDFDTTDFDAIRISLASADRIRSWTKGEVKKPETINYRTFKPEKDGLFCEKIFGPTKDWECSCGKYKGTRYKGIICDRCGVEVTHHRVRRERMGHIELAAPVSHIWYFKSPSNAPLARLLDIKNKDLERVLYFASYIITDVDVEGRKADEEELRQELIASLEEIEADYEREEELLREEYEEAQQASEDEGSDIEPMSDDEFRIALSDLREECREEKQLRSDAFDRFMKLEERELISDQLLFTEMRRYYSMYFDGGMGAEAVRDLLRKVDLDAEVETLRATVADETTQKQKREKAIKRLETVDAFVKGGNDPANMILDVIPVIPPELRPMVALEGGRFAASDLNDLYRRVINRNNRLKRLLELDAPAIIVNNEKRMLQESVDALFDNGRRGRAVTGRGGRPLKSLAEVLKGKQGRFRQNLLGKRVDYSGRSVIVVDPHLKLHQCGLPSAMALELFKPFVLRRLMVVGKGIENIKGAKRIVDRGEPIVWDVLDEVIKNRLVLLNRAPTLHRLSIQAFEPVLIEGKAIHLHPLVCKPFNADFDGDQMSVHVPLSTQAQTEARILMLSSNNLRSPASGVVQTVPSQDMVFGTYFLTAKEPGAAGEGRAFMDFNDVLSAYDNRSNLDIQAEVEVRVGPSDANEFDHEHGKRLFNMRRAVFAMRRKSRKDQFGNVREEFPWQDISEEEWLEQRRKSEKDVELRRRLVDEVLDVTDGSVRFTTTVGRIIFNQQCLPADYPFVNYHMSNSDIKALVNDCCDRYSTSDVEPILDAIKQTGFHYATRAGLTVSVWDAVIPSDKPVMLEDAQDMVDRINDNYEDGFLNQEERHREVIKVWQTCAETLGAKMLNGFEESNPIYMMADSGARGSTTQLRQLAGMRGLMADMKGDTIDLPIKANFREGLEPLEYFISTYGARKGLVDTASHTSDSGYLTRRLVDVAQDVIVREEDCGTDEFVTYDIIKPGESHVDTDLIGRCTLQDVVSDEGEILMSAGDYIESSADLERLLAAGITKIGLRALLTCKSKYGVCQHCYGWDLSTRRPVNIGTAVGIIAAQSIGEPGTQLTMRTIHSGGVAGAEDITQGLPTVARMFDVVGNVNEKILGREADLAPVTGLLIRRAEGNEYVLQFVDEEDPTRVLYEKRVPAAARFMPQFNREDQPFSTPIPVRAGDQITHGFVNFRKLRKLTDIESTMHTFVKSVKDVYTLQSVDLNDKHIEVIARQMLRRVKVTNPADSNYLLGQYVDRYIFADTVRNITLAGGTPPEAEPAILGTLKVASSIDSWLSSASFIRTAGVLTEAAIKGDTDHLIDLKSNVIVGKRIPAGTGLKAYDDVILTYHGKRIDGTTTEMAKSLPEWAPDSLKSIEERLPKRLDWVGDYDDGYVTNGCTISSEDAKLYLFDDLGVSQRWTNKFSEVGIETVGDLIGKTEDDLLRIDGIGAKAIEELREGLESRGLLRILEPEDDEADNEDLSQLLNMVFSPDSDDDVLLGTAAPSTHQYDDEELIGSSTSAPSDEVINERFSSYGDLYEHFSRMEQDDEDASDDE